MSEPGARFGDYVLERLLHRGGRFDHWLAFGPDGHRRFVFSEIHSHLLYDEELRQRALDRLSDRRSIRHSRIPELIDVVQTDDLLAAVYPYVPGVSCSELAQRAGGALPPVIAARIIERIARTIQEARISPRWCSAAVIEPNDLLIDKTGAPRLLRSPVIESHANVTGPGLLVSSILYMSPEGIQGIPVIPQSTVFSLGVLLYELIAGRHPFHQSAGMLLTLRRMIDGAHDPISDHVAVPAQIEAAIERALRSNPEERQLHPGQLAAELDEVLPRDLTESAIREYTVQLCPELADPTLWNADTEPSAPAIHHDEFELLAAIEADRDAEGPYLVYADWLQLNERPRGELIVLQQQQVRADPGRKRELLWAQDELLAKNPELLGELAPLVDRPFTRMFMAFGAGPHFIGDPWLGPVSVAWHLGFFRGVRITVGEHGVDEREVERVLRMLQDLETARFARNVSIGPLSAARSMDEAYGALAGSRLELDSLFVGDLAAAPARTIHRSTANVSSAFPKLKRLAVRGADIHLGRLHLPELRELRIYSAGLTAETLNHVATSVLPELEMLELWFGGAPRRSAWPDRVSVLFDRSRLPSLKRLVLADREPRAVDATVKVLSESELANRLELLDLSESAIEEDTARFLLDVADRFSSLAELRVREASISRELLEALRARYSSQNGRSGPTSSIG